MERSQRRFGDECLNHHWLVSLAKARSIVDVWRTDSRRQRVHSGPPDQSPEGILVALHQQAEAIIAPVGVS